MAITPLPDAPSPSDTAAQFNSKAFAFVAALDQFTTEVNALAVEADADASTASTGASTATTQAGIATTQAGIATTKAGEALASANAAAASFDSFDDRYLGAKASNPTLDNDGAALLEGALYWNTTAKEMRAYNGTAWVTTYMPASATAINYTPSGAGAVATTVQAKLRESVSVLDFGADPTGVADATAAFSAAAQGVTAAVNIVGAEGTLPRAPMCRVRVPAGTYVLTSEVNTGNREVVWELDQAANITGYSFINGEIIRIGQRQADYHHGTTDYACTYSIRSNTNLEDGSEILGITSASQLATYGDRDSVGLYVDNSGTAATVDVGTATYTSTTATIAAPSATVLRQYRRGMIIDTKHSPKWSGIVDSWSTDGSVLTVTGWYEFGGGGSPGTPANGTGCVINGFTKVWAHNANVFLTGNPT